MEGKNNKYNFSLLTKRYLPIASIIFLTFLLMVFFRYNKRYFSRLMEEGKNNIVSFYAQSLKPLFESTEISNEDVFNFALYQTIPIDKENKKLLVVSNEDNNNQVFEVKTASYIPYTNNYERFIEYLELKPDQKHRADSILGAYKKEIYLSILKSGKDAIAINPQLGDLQKAVLADLIAFSEKENASKTYQLFPLNDKSIDVDKLTSFANIAKETTGKNFILITPDTVFQTAFSIDSKALDKLSDIDLNKNLAVSDIKDNFRINIGFDKPSNRKRKVNERLEPGIFHQIDSNFVKVVVPVTRIRRINYPPFNDSIKVNLERTADKLKMFSVKWESNSIQHDKKIGPREPRIPKGREPIQFHFNFDPEAFAKYAANLSRGEYREWEKFGAKIDSIARSLEKTVSDSLKSSAKFQRERIIKKKQRRDIIQRDSI